MEQFGRGILTAIGSCLYSKVWAKAILEAMLLPVSILGNNKSGKIRVLKGGVCPQ